MIITTTLLLRRFEYLPVLKSHEPCPSHPLLRHSFCEHCMPVNPTSHSHSKSVHLPCSPQPPKVESQRSSFSHPSPENK